MTTLHHTSRAGALALACLLCMHPLAALAQDGEAPAKEGDVTEGSDAEGSDAEGSDAEGDDAEGDAEPAPEPKAEEPDDTVTPPEAPPLAEVNPFAPTTRPAKVAARPKKPAPEAEAKKTSIADKVNLGGFLDTKVVTASRQGQDLLDVPASVVVITAEQIRRRGYNNIAEVVQELPGFDTSLVNGTTYQLSYQRGYRTPFTQRTLLMIDGKVDNHLWSHQAALSRQYPLSNIERVEVLYGPAGAVYGPNAFLGIINIITKDASKLERDGVVGNVRAIAGSWNSRGIDANVRAKQGDLALSLTAKVFRSDEADLSGQGPWIKNSQYSDERTWGPLIPHGDVNNPDYNPGVQNAGVPLGVYHDPTDDYGVQAKLSFHDLEIGVLNWQRREGYGAYYTADHAQNNSFWTLNSTQIWAKHEQSFGDFDLESSLSWRSSMIRGNWAEATPDWREGREEYSFISFSDWHSDNSAILFRELLRWKASENVQITAGMKYERKDLTKSYAISGYYSAFQPSSNWDDDGPDGQGSGVYHSSRGRYETPAPNPEEMPNENKVLTDDIGGFVQATLDWDVVGLNLGLRHDINSIYGGSTNPRAAAIFKWSELVDSVDAAALKLIYGTAFQEPPPLLLFGGWQGRNANPLLEPEVVQNIELNHLLRIDKTRLDVSGYAALYDKVLAEQAQNIGQRRVFGVEAKVYQDVPNPLPAADDMSLYAYYSYTRTESNWDYDYDANTWAEGDEWLELGDIAPHKIHMGVHVPVSKHFEANLAGQWISERRLYLANPLRNADRTGGERTLAAYPLAHLNLIGSYGPVEVGLKIRNLLDQRYFHPGPEGASGGDDETATRSSGFQNSVVPTPGRSIWLSVDVALEELLPGGATD